MVNCCCDLGLDGHTKGKTQVDMEGGTHVSLASLVNPSSQGRPLAMLWLSQGLKLWQRVRLGNQPQCLIGGMALETDLHVCHNASGVLYNA